MESFYEWLNEYNKPRTGKKKRRWSVKYKKSINCKNPKGFSQKNYCKRKSRGGHYINELNYVGIEDIDVSQIDRIYNKSDVAVKVVQKYDAATGNRFLTNITTVTPLNQAGVYGLYNSAENRELLGKYDTKRFMLNAEQLEKIKHMPKTVLRKYKIPEEVIKAIQPTDIIHVNVVAIYNHFNDMYKNKQLSPEMAEVYIIREIASTIIHESQHELERRELGDTNETGPLREEKKFASWFDANLKSLQSIQGFPIIKS